LFAVLRSVRAIMRGRRSTTNAITAIVASRLAVDLTQINGWFEPVIAVE
jgi:hypothetical protein